MYGDLDFHELCDICESPVYLIEISCNCIYCLHCFRHNITKVKKDHLKYHKVKKDAYDNFFNLLNKTDSENLYKVAAALKNNFYQGKHILDVCQPKMAIVIYNEIIENKEASDMLKGKVCYKILKMVAEEKIELENIWIKMYLEKMSKFGYTDKKKIEEYFF